MRIRLPITPAAALAVAIIAATEVVFVATTEPLTGLPILQPTADDSMVVVKRDLLPQTAHQIMLVGDSSCLMDIDPDVLGGHDLGRPINLGSLVSFTLPGFAEIATEALDRQPRAVVVSVLPRSFEVTEEQARQFNLLGRYLVAYKKLSPEYNVTLGDRWLWFVHKHRFNIYPPEFGGSFAAFAAQATAMSGHYVERGTYTGPHGTDFHGTFTPTDYSRKGFQQLVTAARERGVPIVLWWSPSPRDAVSDNYLAAASDFVTRLKPEIPDLYVARPAPAWDPSLFGSVTHLTPRAARVNSEQLAEYLRHSLRLKGNLRAALSQ